MDQSRTARATWRGEWSAPFGSPTIPAFPRRDRKRALQPARPASQVLIA